MTDVSKELRTVKEAADRLLAIAQEVKRAADGLPAELIEETKDEVMAQMRAIEELYRKLEGEYSLIFQNKFVFVCKINDLPLADRL